MEGELWKKSEHWRRWNQRWFRLEGNQLVWYGKREDDKVKGQITITPGVIIATQEQKTDNTQRWPFTVTFNSPKYILSLCAGSKSSRSEWIKALSDASSGQAAAPGSPAPSRRNSSRESALTQNAFEANETTLFRSLVKVFVMGRPASVSGNSMSSLASSGTSSSSKSTHSHHAAAQWKELKNPAVVRIMRNDATADIRCIVQERRATGNSSSPPQPILDQLMDPRCKIHHFGHGGDKSRATAWEIPCLPTDASLAKSMSTGLTSFNATEGMRRNRSFDGSSSSRRSQIDGHFSQLSSDRNMFSRNRASLPRGRDGLAAVAVQFVSPQLADQFAFEYERSRQHMKRVLFRRDLDARNRRRSKDRQQMMHEQQMALAQNDGHYSSTIGTSTIGGGTGKKAHSWDVSTYRYNRPGVYPGNSAALTSSGTEGSGDRETSASITPASSDRQHQQSAEKSSGERARGHARHHTNKQSSRHSFNSPNPAPPAARRVSRLPGTVMVSAGSTPVKHKVSAPTSGPRHSSVRRADSAPTESARPTSQFSLTSFSDALPNARHRVSGDDIGEQLDPRVRAVASFKAEQLTSIHEAAQTREQSSDTTREADSARVSAAEDITSVRWENEALRHQVCCLPGRDPSSFNRC
eukprot:INCI4054.2.p1 GENE.INCI4054.2~~INCI4054.2.p1  ORF type:complete len:638 (-),score=76.58 INCI4054.2:684-2597(-)